MSIEKSELNRAGDGMDARDVRTPRLKLHAILFAPRVLPGEFEEAKDLRRVPFDTRPILEAKKSDQALIEDARLMENLGAIFRGQFEDHGWLSLLRRMDAGMVKVEKRFLAMHLTAIRAAIDFVLLQPHRLPNQNDLPSIRTASDADVLLRIVGPALQATP